MRSCRSSTNWRITADALSNNWIPTFVLPGFCRIRLENEVIAARSADEALS